jgi:indolepyruvate ferredoxin oxidoreductase alpha subunit
MLEAFDYSEQVGLPVILRLVTRLCHSRAIVRAHARRPEHDSAPGPGANGETQRTYPRPDPNDWVLVPTNARRRYRRLLDLQGRLLRDAEESPYNDLRLAGPRGIIAAGIAQNYVAEALGGIDDDSMLRIGRYPIPVSLVRRLVDHCEEILVVEDGYPFIERRLNGLLGVPGKAIRGKLTGDIPLDGELTPDAVAAALGTPYVSAQQPLADLAGRPPQLCRGCPHTDSLRALVEAASIYPDAYMFSDIGCYALGVAPPFRAVHSCVDMGASISMAHGAVQAGVRPVICTIGDSTFAHSGLSPLIGAARADADMTVLVMDNATVGMTGAQDTMVSGEALLDAVRGLGVHPEHVHAIAPFPKNHDENVRLIRREIQHKGLSVIVPQRPCIHVKRRAAGRESAGACGVSGGSEPVALTASATT